MNISIVVVSGAIAAKFLISVRIAEQELTTFYDEVVPPDFLAARRSTYAPLPALARKSNVVYQAGSFVISLT